MKLSIYRESRPGDPYCYQHLHDEGGVLPDNFELRLSPHHPVLAMDASEAAGGRSNNEVLHVQVTRENGDVAHIHFSIGLNGQGQLFGEVTAMRGNDFPRRAARVAKWRPPANSAWTG